ncbi:MAG: CPBP family intramembrane metalloprotease [Haliscomenobacter sp.]|nr:CPBP family intramembrane metalloprotease [Haliscomenobacter sp.]MBK7477331.1 CPBP family intramembrane metalloprotease [Haliscomenobacter sp.]MBK8880061.1 CPBP family intramembrane metalloprotease [Haliscomenobacter sp.]
MSPDDQPTIFALTTALTGFLAYHFLAQSHWLRHWIRNRSARGQFSQNRVFAQRFLGILFLGLLPFAATWMLQTRDPDLIGLGKGDLYQSLRATALLSVVIVLITFFNAQKESNLDMYPQIRVKEWSWRLVFWSSLTWALYLLAYEFLFRGLLFFLVLHAEGFAVATAVNVTVYALTHLPKGEKETLGAIPLGFVLCWFTFATGSIWLAVAVHVVMALSNEWLSIYYHPEMRVKKTD